MDVNLYSCGPIPYQLKCSAENFQQLISFGQLPEEVRLQIFKDLANNKSDLSRSCLVSKEWRRVIQSIEVWEAAARPLKMNLRNVISRDLLMGFVPVTREELSPMPLMKNALVARLGFMGKQLEENLPSDLFTELLNRIPLEEYDPEWMEGENLEVLFDLVIQDSFFLHNSGVDEKLILINYQRADSWEYIQLVEIRELFFEAKFREFIIGKKEGEEELQILKEPLTEVASSSDNENENDSSVEPHTPVEEKMTLAQVVSEFLIFRFSRR